MYGTRLRARATGRGSLLLYPSYVRDYLDRVTAADVAAGNTQGLERGVTNALNTALQGMVANGILGVISGVLAQAASVIKASCIMAGARTLSGALVPLASTMPAPTNFNFVSGDYNRKTGLVGNGSTKYLNSNRNNNADPQNSQHFSSFASTASLTAARYMGSGDSAGSSTLGLSNTNLGFRSRNSTNIDTGRPMSNGFIGTSRTGSTNVNVRISGSTSSHNQTSNSPANETIEIFRGAIAPTPSRLAFYSIGESLDLALLDARITTLMNDLAAAIP